jgi:beta-glucan synthesis-associated protein KRE6
VRCCRICNQGRLLAALAFHHSAVVSIPLSLSPASPSPPFRLPPLLSFTMLPSSQVNTNPFEIVSRDQSRSTTPTPSPSPNGSSPALSQDNPSPPSPPSTNGEGQLSATTSQSADQPPSRTPSRSFSNTFVSSPLNPHSTGPYPSLRPRPLSGSRGNATLSRIASEDSQALGSQLASSQRGSMVLWHLAALDDQGALPPPPSLSPNNQRGSVVSTASRDSMWTLSSDSKFPSSTMRGGLVPYAWDPSADDQDDDADEEDSLHAPESVDKSTPLLNPRSISNIGVLILLVGFLLGLFIVLPVVTYVQNSSHSIFNDETSVSNFNTPQGALHVSSLVDPDTPQSARTRVGFDGQQYNLVFSDEFNLDNRSFEPGDDPFWEAVDLWYGQTGDIEWYDSSMVYTANGSLHVRIENVPSNGMSYRSGMLQSWNKFCFSSGYIEVALTLPGPDEETRGYVSANPHFPTGRLCLLTTHLVAWALDDGQSRQTRIRCNDRRHMALLVSIPLSFAFKLFDLNTVSQVRFL